MCFHIKIEENNLIGSSQHIVATAVYGVAQSRTRLRQLSSSSSGFTVDPLGALKVSQLQEWPSLSSSQGSTFSLLGRQWWKCGPGTPH